MRNLHHATVAALLLTSTPGMAADMMLFQWTGEGAEVPYLMLDRERIAAVEVRRGKEFQHTVEVTLDAADRPRFEFRCKDVTAARLLIDGLRSPERAAVLDLTAQCAFGD